MNAYYTRLPREALLHINGPDSLTFLQGQTTCDTRQVDTGHALPGAFCTPQGRTICDFLLAQLGEEHYALRLRADILETAAITFGKYIVFSKAELDAKRRDWQVVACWGGTAAKVFADLLDDTPAARYDTVSGEGYVLVQLDDNATQFEAYIDMDRHGDHFAALQAAMEPGTEEAWRALQVRAGMGRVESPTVEEFIPQMLNYDRTGHISFNKGCYTGQEIVARLHYRGKAKRRMYLAELPTCADPEAGKPLYSSGSQQSVGTVVNYAVEEDRTVCLVSATESGVSQGLHLGSVDGPALTIGALPYPIESD